MGATQPASALFLLAILGMLAAVIVPFLSIRSMTEDRTPTRTAVKNRYWHEWGCRR